MAATNLDRFRTALASATRAIARNADADVVYATETSGTTGKIARVVSPGAGLEPRLVAEARGAADSAALRLRHHDPAVHGAMSPADAEARAVFDALETARVEALGSRTMDGVRANLDRHVEARVRGDAIGRARSAEEVPLATAVGLIARQRLTGSEPSSPTWSKNCPSTIASECAAAARASSAFSFRARRPASAGLIAPCTAGS